MAGWQGDLGVHPRPHASPEAGFHDGGGGGGGRQTHTPELLLPATLVSLYLLKQPHQRAVRSFLCLACLLADRMLKNALRYAKLLRDAQRNKNTQVFALRGS